MLAHEPYQLPGFKVQVLPCFCYMFSPGESFVEVGHAVAQLVEALRYKLEVRGFDSRWCHWIFPLTNSFRPHYGPGVDSASNRNEGVKAAGA